MKINVENEVEKRRSRMSSRKGASKGQLGSGRGGATNK